MADEFYAIIMPATRVRAFHGAGFKVGIGGFESGFNA
jgi:hypothetical protein